MLSAHLYWISLLLHKTLHKVSTHTSLHVAATFSTGELLSSTPSFSHSFFTLYGCSCRRERDPNHCKRKQDLKMQFIQQENTGLFLPAAGFSLEVNCRKNGVTPTGFVFKYDAPIVPPKCTNLWWLTCACLCKLMGLLESAPNENGQDTSNHLLNWTEQASKQ